MTSVSVCYCTVMNKYTVQVIFTATILNKYILCLKRHKIPIDNEYHDTRYFQNMYLDTIVSMILPKPTYSIILQTK